MRKCIITVILALGLTACAAEVPQEKLDAEYDMTPMLDAAITLHTETLEEFVQAKKKGGKIRGKCWKACKKEYNDCMDAIDVPPSFPETSVISMEDVPLGRYSECSKAFGKCIKACAGEKEPKKDDEGDTK